MMMDEWNIGCEIDATQCHSGSVHMTQVSSAVGMVWTSEPNPIKPFNSYAFRGAFFVLRHTQYLWHIEKLHEK